MAIKVCKKCGAENSENDVYCNSCSASLADAKTIGVSDDEKFNKPRPERCPRCDKQITGRPVLCPFCGFDISSNEDDRYDFSISDEPAHSKNIGIYILSFIIPLIGIIIGAIWLSNDDKKEEGRKAIFYAILGIVVGIIFTQFIIK